MSNWADDADVLDQNKGVNTQLQITQTLQSKPQKSHTPVGFGSSYRSSPLDVFNSGNSDFPFQDRGSWYNTSDDYLITQKQTIKPLEWKRKKYHVYKRSLCLKMQQHAELKQLLLNYVGQPIVELSNHPYWGGVGVGKNMAGKALMSVIDQINVDMNSTKIQKKSEKKTKKISGNQNIFDLLESTDA